MRTHAAMQQAAAACWRLQQVHSIWQHGVITLCMTTAHESVSTYPADTMTLQYNARPFHLARALAPDRWQQRKLRKQLQLQPAAGPRAVAAPAQVLAAVQAPVLFAIAAVLVASAAAAAVLAIVPSAVTGHCALLPCRSRRVKPMSESHSRVARRSSRGNSRAASQTVRQKHHITERSGSVSSRPRGSGVHGSWQHQTMWRCMWPWRQQRDRSVCNSAPVPCPLLLCCAVSHFSTAFSAHTGAQVGMTECARLLL